jgi:hypothetical protein
MQFLTPIITASAMVAPGLWCWDSVRQGLAASLRGHPSGSVQAARQRSAASNLKPECSGLRASCDFASLRRWACNANGCDSCDAKLRACHRETGEHDHSYAVLKDPKTRVYHLHGIPLISMDAAGAAAATGTFGPVAVIVTAATLYVLTFLWNVDLSVSRGVSLAYIFHGGWMLVAATAALVGSVTGSSSAYIDAGLGAAACLASLLVHHNSLSALMLGAAATLSLANHMQWRVAEGDVSMLVFVAVVFATCYLVSTKGA